MDIVNIIILFVGWILAWLFGASVWSWGLVTIPLLLFVWLPIQTTIATNRFGAVFLEFASALRYYKEKKLNFKLWLVFWIIASVGSVIWANIVLNIDERYLKLITAVLLVVVFLFLMYKSKIGLKDKKISKKNWIIASIWVFIFWIYGWFFWTWFGTFIMFVFLYFWIDFVKSAAISRVVWVIMSFVATIVFMINWAINYKYAVSLWLWLAIWWWIWAWLWVKIWNKYIKILFISIILITILKLLYESFI